MSQHHAKYGVEWAPDVVRAEPESRAVLFHLQVAIPVRGLYLQATRRLYVPTLRQRDNVGAW